MDYKSIRQMKSEVVHHLGKNVLKCIAIDGTEGLDRNQHVLNTISPSPFRESVSFQSSPRVPIRDRELPDRQTLLLVGLHRWKELLAGSGLFVCYSSVKSNGVLAISVGEHEVLAQNLRHAVGSTSPLVGVAAYKPLSKDKVHCLVLHDDGSLQIHSHIPAGNDTGISVMSDKVKKLRSGNNFHYALSDVSIDRNIGNDMINLTIELLREKGNISGLTLE
ncbi:auxin transport protein BIG [Forsythia ovata]|uniref:Auxin transport protein BIG n=1 Tax=Forsythia ovata TaxID=205694 RepID=A0ABD1WHC4_9LAMI